MSMSTDKTSRRVEFFFDVGSPASYLAWTQLPALCTAAGAELVLRPMLLGGVFQATGNASPATVPAKGRYTFIDMSRFARRYGVALRTNPHFPINTLVPDARRRRRADARGGSPAGLSGSGVHGDLGRWVERG